MQLIVAGLQLALFVGVAAPDVFGVKGWRWMAGLVAIYLLSEWFRGLARAGVLDHHRKVFENLGELISSMAGMQAGNSAPQIVRNPEDAIGLLLRRACELVQVTVRPPLGCEITANLVLPVIVDQQPTGFRVTAQDDFRPGRDHPVIPLDAPGAPFTFSTGRPVSVAATSEVKHPRVQGRRYRSIGTFPIMVGEPGTTGQVIGILAMDATEPYIFDSGAMARLSPFLGPVAQLIGLALVTRRPGSRNVRAQRRSA
ncbi:GAF domain-containing protein [Longimicrobium sp.]|uniref:GAF domain-containing protein n=1 Tax=Longimicrobium sp. TaxID=2029185 RepID=UPI003B3ADEA9